GWGGGGPWTAPSGGRGPRAAMAAAQPAYPAGSVPSSMSTTKATAAGCRAMKSGVNQRGGTISLIAVIPAERTSAARSSHDCRDGIGVIVAQHTTREEIRSGALAASH